MYEKNYERPFRAVIFVILQIGNKSHFPDQLSRFLRMHKQKSINLSKKLMFRFEPVLKAKTNYINQHNYRQIRFH